LRKKGKRAFLDITGGAVQRNATNSLQPCLLRPFLTIRVDIYATGGYTLGSRGFYVRAYNGSLLPRAPDMLTVRFGQLTVRGLPPLKIRSIVGCFPNAQAEGAAFFPSSLSSASSGIAAVIRAWPFSSFP
jgi:hypothetical protein